MRNVVRIESFGENFFVNFPNSQFRSTGIHKLINNVSPTGSLLDHKLVKNAVYLLYEIRAALEQNHRIDWDALGRTKTSKPSEPKQRKCVNPGHATRLQFMLCNHVTRLAGLISATGLYSQSMTEKLILVWLIFSDEAWFHSHWHISSKNNRYWNSINSHLVHEVPLREVKFGLWCITATERITELIINAETINCDKYGPLKWYRQCVRVQGHKFQHLLQESYINFIAFRHLHLTRKEEYLVALGVESCSTCRQPESDSCFRLYQWAQCVWSSEEIMSTPQVSFMCYE
jgi:hypothetical protein